MVRKSLFEKETIGFSEKKFTWKKKIHYSTDFYMGANLKRRSSQLSTGSGTNGKYLKFQNFKISKLKIVTEKVETPRSSVIYNGHLKSSCFKSVLERRIHGWKYNLYTFLSG